MISDVLSDFVEAMDHYLNHPTYRRTYDWRQRALAVLIRHAADELRAELDRAPGAVGELMHPYGICAALLELYQLNHWPALAQEGGSR